jgi:hypothetical protein
LPSPLGRGLDNFRIPWYTVDRKREREAEMAFYHVSREKPLKGQRFESYHHADIVGPLAGLEWLVPECQLEQAKARLRLRAQGKCPGVPAHGHPPTPAIDLDTIRELSQQRLPCPHSPACPLVDAVAEAGFCVRLPGLAAARSPREMIALAREWDLIVDTDVFEAEVSPRTWVWVIEGREVARIPDGVVIEVSEVKEVLPLARFAKKHLPHYKIRAAR